MIEDYSTISCKSGEVDSFVRHQKLAFVDACSLVGIAPAVYCTNSPAISWIPLPDQIVERTQALQNGDVVIDGESNERWQAERKRKVDIAEMASAMPWLFDGAEEAHMPDPAARTVFRPGTRDDLPRFTTKLSGAFHDDDGIIFEGLPNVVPTECPNCGASFRNPAAMRMHSRTCQGALVGTTTAE